jgi:hypothetical protein
MAKKPFDPEGSGYDDDFARKAGLKRDATGHMPSRDPKSGRILKGRKHPTFHKTLKGEKDAGFEIFKGKGGFLFSRPRKGKGSKGVEEFQKGLE